jgi:hypothetical protein
MLIRDGVSSAGDSSFSALLRITAMLYAALFRSGAAC